MGFAFSHEYFPQGLSWKTKEGTHSANYFGSVTQASTVRLGSTAEGDDIFVPLGKLLPMVYIANSALLKC